MPRQDQKVRPPEPLCVRKSLPQVPKTTIKARLPRPKYHQHFNEALAAILLSEADLILSMLTDLLIGVSRSPGSTFPPGLVEHTLNSTDPGSQSLIIMQDPIFTQQCLNQITLGTTAPSWFQSTARALNQILSPSSTAFHRAFFLGNHLIVSRCLDACLALLALRCVLAATKSQVGASREALNNGKPGAPQNLNPGWGPANIILDHVR